MKIPSDNIWTQTNQSDVFGVLHDTMNVTMDTFGKVKLSKKPFALYTDSDDTDLAVPLAINYFNGKYNVMTTDEMFTFDLENAALTQIASSPSFVFNSDATICYNNIYATVNTSFARYTGSTWTTEIGTLTAGVPHPIELFDSLTTYKVAIGDGSNVKLYDSSNNLFSTQLVIPAQFVITTIRYRSGYLYIGTRHKYGGEAKIFIWDGDTANANYEVLTGASWVFSMTPYKSTVACVTDKGQLLYINGSSAEQLAAFPVYYRPDLTWQDNTGYTLNGKVFNRGMVSVGDTIYLNVDGTLANGFLSEMRSGLWVYDPNIGLYHRASHSLDVRREDAGLSVTDSVITTSADHELKTGDAVQFTSVSGLSGIDDGVVYFVSVVSTNKLKLAKSRKALIAGNFVTITGTAGASDKLLYVTNTDYYQYQNASSGAIGLVSPQDGQLKMWSSDVIWGCALDNFTQDAKYALLGLTDAYNVGRITTQRIYSENISSVWKEIYAFIDGINNEGEEIHIKYRTEFEERSEVIAGYWVDSTSIVSDFARLDQDDWDSVQVGDEINIVDGYGRGQTAHVTKKTKGASSYTIEIDESLGNANSPTFFYRENFKKGGVYTKDRKEKDYVKTALTPQGKGSWVQIKLELRGFQTEVSHLQLTNSVDKSAV